MAHPVYRSGATDRRVRLRPWNPAKPSATIGKPVVVGYRLAVSYTLE